MNNRISIVLNNPPEMGGYFVLLSLNGPSPSVVFDARASLQMSPMSVCFLETNPLSSRAMPFVQE